ncbi:MAG TPA: hypothetical protein VEJ84_07565 [Acidimicrobiales bacterium]|nr:hypothetical protein [Acidimicrobiales bacterium]
MPGQRTAVLRYPVLIAVALLAGPSAAAGASTTIRAPVLGSKSFAGPPGVGWGTYKPAEVFNGGDPSGMVKSITWTGWGTAQAVGYGQTYIFKPGGGYYAGSVRAELRASALGHCAPGGPLAYTQLAAREPSQPGGPLGRWFAWSGAKTICHSHF